MTERFILCHNPEQATRDTAVREQLLAQLTTMIERSDRFSARKRAELRGRISTMPGLNRYLRVTPSGLLRIDQATIKTEQHLDGKWLLRCSDPALSAQDIARGYKQLLEVERGWRDLKTHLDLRPVHHHAQHRIRAHVLCAGWRCCWCASPRPATPPAPGGGSANSSRPCTSRSSPATPAPRTNPPSSPPTSATSSPTSSWPLHPGSCTSTPPPAHDNGSVEIKTRRHYT